MKCILFFIITLFHFCSTPKKIIDKVDNNLFSISGTVAAVEPKGLTSYMAKISGTRDAEVYIDSLNLKYPASYTVFKKGDVVAINCLSFNINVSVNNPFSSSKNHINAQEFTFVKTDQEFDEICIAELPENAVKIENMVEFFPDKNSTFIKFTLRITNLNDSFIPALTPINNGRIFNNETDECITKFFINDESKGLSIYNGISQKNETLNRGGVSETSESYVLTGSSNFDSDFIVIQWKYKGILSKKVKVDTKKQAIIE